MRTLDIRRLLIDFSIPLTILLAATLLFRLTHLDLTIESLFYLPGQGWPHERDWPWHPLYLYGNRPAILMVVVAVIGLVGSLFTARLVRYRKIALFVILLMLIGQIVLVNVLFKDHWYRPRPRQVDLFGGPAPYVPVLEKGQQAGKYRSFPSGHAGVGFFVMAPFFWLRDQAPRAARIWLGVGLAYGLLMGLSRMIQGGHFPSDVLWSGGFIYLTGLALYYLFRFDRTVWWERG